MKRFNLPLIFAILFVLIMIGIFVPRLNAQGSNTIYQGQFVNSSIVSPLITPPVRNIGQAGHEFHLRYVNNPPNVCLNPASVEFMQGSFDNTNWFNFGLNSGAGVVNAATVRNLSGQGAYPFVRLNITTFDNVNCRVNVDYSGVLVQPPITTIQGVFPNVPVISTDSALQVNPVLIGGIGNNAWMQSAPLCNVNTYVTAATGNLISIQPGAVGAGVRTRICSIFLSGDNAGTVVDLVESNVIGCGVVTATFTPALTVGTGYIAMGGGFSPLFTSAPGNYICLRVGGVGNGRLSASYVVY